MKKAVAMILAMLISAFLVACGKQMPETPPADSEQTDTGGYLDRLPKNNTGYTELRAVAFETYCISREVPDEESEVDRSLCLRDEAVRRRYGIDIRYTSVTAKTAVDAMRRSVKSGDNTFNVFLYQAQELMMLATEDCLQNLSGVRYLDLTQDWYNRSLNRNLTLQGRLYCTAGQYSQWYFGAPICMVYNKTVMTDYGIPDIDELAESGDWTLETLTRICTDSNITADTDQNGVMDVRDTYMITAYTPALYGLFASAGGHFSVLNEETGAVTLNITDSASISRLDAIIGAFHSGTTFYSDAIKDAEDVFAGGRALFFYAPLGFAADLINVSFDYGIVQSPKLNSMQKEYISCANPQSNFCFGVPLGLAQEETDFVGLIMEAYNYLSSEMVKPAKYDTFMKFRVADDPKSSARLDQMFDALYFDMNLVMDFGKTRTLINQTIFNETTNRFVSSVKASQSLIDEDIKALLGTK